MALVGGVVLGRQDDGLASESMAQSVEPRALFPGFGAGAGGMLRIRFIHGGTADGAIETIGDIGVRHKLNLDSGIACGFRAPTDGCGQVVASPGAIAGVTVVIGVRVDPYLEAEAVELRLFVDIIFSGVAQEGVELSGLLG